MGGLKQEPVDDAIRDAEEKQEKERERDILRELKKRGSILERDLHELPLQNVDVNRVKNCKSQ